MGQAPIPVRILSRRNFDKTDVESIYGSFVKQLGGNYFTSGGITNHQNILVNSNNLAGTGWTTSNLTLTAPPSTLSSAPDGSFNAWIVSDNVTNTFHFIQQTPGTFSNPQTFSMYAAARTGTANQIWVQWGVGASVTFFDLSLGTIPVLGANASATITSTGILSSSGTMFYRITLTTLSGATNPLLQVGMGQSGATQYAGGSSTQWWCFMQGQLSSVATEYIDTGATAWTTGFLDWRNFSPDAGITNIFKSANKSIFEVCMTDPATQTSITWATFPTPSTWTAPIPIGPNDVGPFTITEWDVSFVGGLPTSASWALSIWRNGASVAVTTLTQASFTTTTITGIAGTPNAAFARSTGLSVPLQPNDQLRLLITVTTAGAASVFSMKASVWVTMPHTR